MLDLFVQSDRPLVNIPIPDNEDERLAALHRLNLLDTEPEALFDQITTLAQQIFGVSTAAVSLVDDDRQWFKSMCGWDLEQTPREISFCTYTILDESLLVVEDAAEDERFAYNPNVSLDKVRFYAGAPLAVEGGLHVGSLCLIDEEPRSFSDAEREKLSTLADVVVDLLETRRMKHQIGYLHSALEEAQDAVIITEGAPLDPPGPRIVWTNKAFSRMTGYEREEVIGQSPRILQGPETSQSVLDKVRRGLENERSVHAETVNYRKDGTSYIVSWHISPVRNDDEVTHWVSIQRDVTDQRRKQAHLQHEAHHDSLTDLPNRYVVQQTIQELIADSPDQETGVLLYLDLDDFKPLNDDYGHQLGDQVLIRTADVLREVVRSQDTIGRIGGDEFVVCLPTLDTRENARTIAERLYDALHEPFQIGPHEIQVRPSIGGALHLSSYGTADEALHVADMAMYEAKAQTDRKAILWSRQEGKDASPRQEVPTRSTSASPVG